MIKTSLDDLMHHLSQDVGIGETDSAFYFTSLRSLGFVDFSAEEFVYSLQELHKCGGFFLPTFSYSWNEGQHYDASEKNAPKMGYLGNGSIGLDSMQRTNHPTFSVNSWFSKPAMFDSVRPTTGDAFGVGSVFHNIYTHQPDTAIVLIGDPFPDVPYRSTFIHTAQILAGSWYRYLKEFYNPSRPDLPAISQLVRYRSVDEYRLINSREPKCYKHFPIVEDFSDYSVDLFRCGLLRTFPFRYGQTRITHVKPSIDLFVQRTRQNPDYGLAQC